jgi:GT2 family glycosyltransferase
LKELASLEMKKSKLIVVLGMHRSGTSAITRGLQVLGVGLGDRLMPAIEDNNAKGFWEDIDLNALNIEMLSVIDSDWHYLAPMTASDVEVLRSKGYFLRATELLRQKVGSTPVFGFKDPRVTKLLPFWKKVFRHCQFDVNYVLAVRHPLSVVKSLAKRDGFETEKSYLLWLGHVITGLLESKGSRRMLVDYDSLMQLPEHQLDRIAKCFGLALDASELQTYKTEFLDQDLRHSMFEPKDLELDKSCPALVREVYKALLDVAIDKIQIDDAAIQKRVEKWNTEFGRLNTMLTLVDRLQLQKTTVEQIVVNRDSQISSLKQAAAERDTQISNLRQIVAERDGQISNLKQIVAERDGQIANLKQVVAERDGQIANLRQIVAERDGQLVNLKQTVVERDGQLVNLKQIVTERDGQIASLNERTEMLNNRLMLVDQEISERNRTVQAQANTIAELQSSTSWRITRPLRYVGIQGRKAKDVRAIVRRLLQDEPLMVQSKKVLRVLHREGWQGVKVRIRHQHYLATQSAVVSPAALPCAEMGFSLEPAAIVRDLQGHYTLAAAAKGYTYIEPQCPADLEAQLKAMQITPLFSIVVPVYNTTPELLQAVLVSVQAQWYPHWQLVLADDASPAEATRKALSQIEHPQVKLLRLENNQGIAGATNAALEAADGDFIVFMDHDDELTVDCLYELALCIERELPDVIYSDEDKLTEDGQYTQPHFKPDWSPDTMMSTMFTCHVSCVRRSLLEKVGGLRSEYDGCQDWDFVLRVSEHTSRISHIPKVLYHWRIISESVASDIAAKPYVLEASRRARMDALERRGLKGSVEAVSQVPGYFRVNYHLRGTPSISIIIPSRDNGQVLQRCIDSIQKKSSYRNFEIIILDNGSADQSTLSYLQELHNERQARVIRHDAPFNFSELNNIGAKNASGELLLFLNDDTEVLCSDWLERMGGYAQLSHVGAVGAKLLYPGGKEVQHAGILNLVNGPVHAFLRNDSERPGYFMRNLLEYNWLAVTGACLMMEASKFNALGGFDVTLPIAYNDIELCLRSVEKGFYNVVCQAVTLIHHESVSRGLDHVDPLKLQRLQKELGYLYSIHPGYFQYDPFHNPNLHPSGLNFEVPA